MGAAGARSRVTTIHTLLLLLLPQLLSCFVCPSVRLRRFRLHTTWPSAPVPKRALRFLPTCTAPVRVQTLFFLKKKSSNNRPAPERDLRAWRRDERRRTKGAGRHGPRLSRLDRDREGPCFRRRRRCRWPRDARARAPNPAAFLLLLLCASLGACALSLKCSASGTGRALARGALHCTALTTPRSGVALARTQHGAVSQSHAIQRGRRYFGHVVKYAAGISDAV